MAKRLLVEELYPYLVSLRDLLKQRGAAEAAGKVHYLSMLASGSTSELYGEARLALPWIAEECAPLLSEAERGRLQEVIDDVEHELSLVGGA